MRADQQSQGVRAANRVLDVIEALSGRIDGLGLTDLARITSIPKTTVSRYVLTLVERGYVVRGPGADNYRIPYALQPLRQQDVASLVAAVRPWLLNLRGRFQHTLNLGVLEANRVTYLEVMADPATVRFTARPGSRALIHSTALGKAIAAQLREPEVRRILRLEGLPPRTSKTVTMLEAFLRELQDVRRRGYAREFGENDENVACVAVPVHGAPVLTAISLTAPVGRLDSDTLEEVARGLTEAADAVTDVLTLAPGKGA